MTSITLRGPVYSYGLVKGVERKFIVVTLPFGTAREIFRSDPYTAKTGFGEQRAILPGHAKKLKTAMLTGEFTPTPVHVGLRPEQQEAVKYTDAGEAELEASSDHPLPLVNGGHRFYALDSIRVDCEFTIDRADTESEKEEARQLLSRVDRLPITVEILLDGEPQQDFVKLQLGRRVDSAHLLALKVQNKLLTGRDAETTQLAFKVADRLTKDPRSSLYLQVRFDSTSSHPFPVSSLCLAGSGVASSFVGLSRVGLMNEEAKQSDQWLAKMFSTAHVILNEKAPELLERRMVLTPPPDGNKGSTSMLIGLSTMLAYRVLAQNQDEPTQKDQDLFVDAAQAVCDREVAGNLSGPHKRALLGDFAKAFLGDLPGSKHDGVPFELVKLMTPSALGLKPMPKKPRVPKSPTTKRPRKKQKAPLPSKKSDTQAA